MHWGFSFWPLIPLFWLVIAFCVFGVLRQRSGWRNWHFSPSPSQQEPSALEILCRRYARGEIDTATLEEMRERIQASGR